MGVFDDDKLPDDQVGLLQEKHADIYEQWEPEYQIYFKLLLIEANQNGPEKYQDPGNIREDIVKYLEYDDVQKFIGKALTNPDVRGANQFLLQDKIDEIALGMQDRLTGKIQPDNPYKRRTLTRLKDPQFKELMDGDRRTYIREEYIKPKRYTELSENVQELGQYAKSDAVGLISQVSRRETDPKIAYEAAVALVELTGKSSEASSTTKTALGAVEAIAKNHPSLIDDLTTLLEDSEKPHYVAKDSALIQLGIIKKDVQFESDLEIAKQNFIKDPDAPDTVFTTKVKAHELSDMLLESEAIAPISSNTTNENITKQPVTVEQTLTILPDANKVNSVTAPPAMQELILQVAKMNEVIQGLQNEIAEQKTDRSLTNEEKIQALDEKLLGLRSKYNFAERGSVEEQEILKQIDETREAKWAIPGGVQTSLDQLGEKLENIRADDRRREQESQRKELSDAKHEANLAEQKARTDSYNTGDTFYRDGQEQANNGTLGHLGEQYDYSNFANVNIRNRETGSVAREQKGCSGPSCQKDFTQAASPGFDIESTLEKAQKVARQAEKANKVLDKIGIDTGNIGDAVIKYGSKITDLKF